MITCIKLKGKFNVGVNQSSCIDVGGTNVALKDIPFVRYDFDSYNDEEVEYIKKMMSKFSLSTHMIQYKLDENLMNSLSKTGELLDKVAKYLYISISQEDFLNGVISSDRLNLFSTAIQTVNFDRIMLVDNTQNMDMVGAKKLIKYLSKTYNIKLDKIGVCSSPLCMTDELACLTALKARELASIYSDNSEVALPSANHQCMNCCGCIRYFDVTQDLEAPADTKKKETTKKEKEAGESKSTTPKKVAKPKVFTLSNFV